MLLYRRRLLIYCVLFLLIIVQPFIYIYFLSYRQYEDRVQIFIPENISDRASIYNVNTRILCWIPTTLKRLDRAIVVHE